MKVSRDDYIITSHRICEWVRSPVVSSEPLDANQLVRDAERLNSLADTAELMGDQAGAERFRADASARRMIAMHLLDG